MTKPDTEFSRWRKLPDGQKSFAVELLHFFHYVPQRVRRCWTREELLTWELYRALELLPRLMALRPFVSLCAEAGGNAAAATSQLLRDLDPVQVVPYPRLNLGGNKRNCKADL